MTTRQPKSEKAADEEFTQREPPLSPQRRVTNRQLGFPAKAVLLVLTLLVCVGIRVLLGLGVQWFIAPSPLPST